MIKQKTKRRIKLNIRNEHQLSGRAYILYGIQWEKMVFESIVTDLMNRFLGDFIENLDHKQLNIGIWGGKYFNFFYISRIFFLFNGQKKKIGIYMVWLTSYCQNVIHILLVSIDFSGKINNICRNAFYTIPCFLAHELRTIQRS